MRIREAFHSSARPAPRARGRPAVTSTAAASAAATASSSAVPSEPPICCALELEALLAATEKLRADR
ncbi:MAG TPA: hypothetical protein VHW23_14935 [Kofleriaceae bacterium]|nr:hypothetical protein [Kofleriaceae bacterium]